MSQHIQLKPGVEMVPLTTRLAMVMSAVGVMTSTALKPNFLPL